MSELLSITLPTEIIEKINEGSKARDMSKSRYVLRLLEKAYEIEEKGAVQ